MLYLLTAPGVLKKLINEIDAAITAGAVSRPVISSIESRRLPYLQACIREGLRMQPPFTGLLLKVVPPAGDLIDGRFLPGGTKVGHCVFGAFRDERLWGPDAAMFRPERWLEEGDEGLERRRRMEKDLDVVFGSGRWGCAGKTVAYMELDKIFFEVSRLTTSQLGVCFCITSLLLSFDCSWSMDVQSINMGCVLLSCCGDSTSGLSIRVIPGRARTRISSYSRICGFEFQGVRGLIQDRKKSKAVF